MPVLGDISCDSVPFCPFCATKLDTDAHGDGIFRKLIINFDKQEQERFCNEVCIRSVTGDSDTAISATDSAPPSVKKAKTLLRHKIMNLFRQR